MTTAAREGSTGVDQSRTPEFGSETMDLVVGKISALVERKIRGAFRQVKVGDNEEDVVVDESVLDALAKMSATSMTLSSTNEDDETIASNVDEKVLTADRLIGAVKAAANPGNEEAARTFADYMKGFRYQIGDLLDGIDLDKAADYYLAITVSDGVTTEEEKPNRVEFGRKLSSFLEQKKEEPAKKPSKRK